jgi:hypothetical protein
MLSRNQTGLLLGNKMARPVHRQAIDQVLKFWKGQGGDTVEKQDTWIIGRKISEISSPATIG